MKNAALAVALVALGSVSIFGINAQQNSNKPRSPSATTNWVGYLVVAREDSIDRIAPGPHPQTVRQIQIGLRSDGLVIWRGAANVK
ncbi:MAG TPA: hypothetical protein VKA67_11835 [Verrucomicrobiae bacterium]|nr:hypothetical protein [Verrucomicrobiae bacterium]